ncbi:hypothetical protein, partial [Dialister succinatiphilus]|uniref:hypothetical protein n=1 Tax=Dialister succinatiphilus TaxID=487173 RepID=UPI003AB7BC02
PPLEMTVAAGGILSFLKRANDKNAALIPVISTEAKRSGEISLLNSPRNMEAGELSTQSIIGAVPVCLPQRHAAPLEMTVLAGGILSFQKRTNDKKRCPHPRHFDRSEAEWRNLTPPWYMKH